MKYFYSLIFFVGIIFTSVTILKEPKKDKSSKEYFAWKASHDEDLKRNRELQLKILDPRFTFDSLEIVEVSPGKKYYSLWGHLMLRFKGSSGVADPESDLVLSFLADFNDFPVNNFKASTGGYVVLPKIGLVKDYRKEYEVGEGRQIKFFRIITDKKNELNVLSILRQWIVNPETPGGYSFFYLNCVSLMVKLLHEANIIKEYGIYGYILKEHAQTELEKCLEEVKAGNRYASIYLQDELIVSENKKILINSLVM